LVKSARVVGSTQGTGKRSTGIVSESPKEGHA
jgi:hypothetical protein